MMKIIALRKIHQGKYLSYYEGDFINENGTKKTYEFTSRNPLLTLETFSFNKSVGVGLVALNKTHDKVLLEKEFRCACNRYIYNFPAGLIDNDEKVEETAKRELKEETGLSLIRIIDVLPPSYVSPGTTDELMQIIVCEVEGEIKPSCYELEDIEASWFNKKEVKKLLKEKTFMSTRTQMFLWCWANKE